MPVANGPERSEGAQFSWVFSRQPPAKPRFFTCWSFASRHGSCQLEGLQILAALHVVVRFPNIRTKNTREKLLA
jgi:hypothetical protein